MDSLYTSFVPAEQPLPEYPRPQLARSAWQNLNGLWEYAISDSSALPAAWDGFILVPFCAESALSGVQRAVLPGQTLWYKRTFRVENYRPTQRTLLHFGAVDQCCRVFVNGHEAGGHTGGYCPFTLDITAFALRGENELTVAVTDDTDSGDGARGKQVLAPKGIWYTAVTGIWQTVWLEQVPPRFIGALRITPTLESVTVRVLAQGGRQLSVRADDSASPYDTPLPLAEQGARQPEPLLVRVRVLDGDMPVCEELVDTDDDVTLSIPSPTLWTPENPHLYRLIVTLGEDRVESYFGLRTFSTDFDDAGLPRLFLNGKPYFQRGLLDQGYWPDGLYTAPSDEALCSDILAAKRMGFNMLRKHIKVEPARWYYHCDHLGMLVWQDMPSGAAYPGDALAVALPNAGVHVRDNNYRRFKREDSAGRAQFLQELRDMINTLYNVPSLCTWVPFNEGWGQFDSAAAAQQVRALDSTRWIDHASGWHDQGAGDFLSIHKYILRVKLPRRKNSDTRPFVLSEYGGYSQIQPNHVWDEAKSFGYRMYPTREALTQSFLALHTQQILPLVAEGLCATVYTQLADVELEVNGLLTYDRAVCKLEEAAVRKINEKLVL